MRTYADLIVRVCLTATGVVHEFNKAEGMIPILSRVHLTHSLISKGAARRAAHHDLQIVFKCALRDSRQHASKAVMDFFYPCALIRCLRQSALVQAPQTTLLSL